MSEHRNNILKINREIIEQCYVTAIRKGRQHPVIAIYSLSDPIGRKTAVSLTSEQYVANIESDCLLTNHDPLLTTDIEHKDAILQFTGPEHNDTSVHITACIRLNKIPVVIIADNGVSLESTEKPDMPADLV